MKDLLFTYLSSFTVTYHSASEINVMMKALPAVRLVNKKN